MDFNIILKCAKLFKLSQSTFSAKLTCDDLNDEQIFTNSSLADLLLEINHFIHRNGLYQKFLILKLKVFENNKLLFDAEHSGTEMSVLTAKTHLAAKYPVVVKVKIPLHMPGRPPMADVKKEIVFQDIDEALVWADQQQAEKLPENEPWLIEITSRVIMPDGNTFVSEKKIYNPRVEFK